MENVQQLKKKKRYKWTEDKKIIGLILGSVVILLFIFSFLKIPFLSSIHDYTLGMLLGYHSILVYLYLFFVATKMMFSDKVRIPSWFKLNNKTYLFLSLSIIFISSSSGYYQVHTHSWLKFGLSPTKSVSYWWNDVFTKGDVWTPNNSNGGFLGSFFYLITGAATSGTGSLIISIILLILSLSILVTGSLIGLYKNINLKRKNINLKEEMEVDEEVIVDDIDDIEETELPENIKSFDDKNQVEKKEVEILPFDEDPFDE